MLTLAGYTITERVSEHRRLHTTLINCTSVPFVLSYRAKVTDLNIFSHCPYTRYTELANFLYLSLIQDFLKEPEK
jgi:lipid A disaccharide synthetase